MSETEDSDLPTILPILRISSHQGTKQQRRDSQKEVKAVAPETQNGKICYEDVLHLLTCPTCESHVSTPVIQCKRGHLSCEDCSRQQQECPICHQSWMDGPNVILDKIINLIALPCKYGKYGCPIITVQSERLKHQTVCDFRPVHCPYSSHGCSMVLAVKTNNSKSSDDIPEMPIRKKASPDNKIE